VFDETLTRKSLDGFDLAVTDMTTNLNAELTRFENRVKQEKVAKIEHRQGYGGSMATLLFLLVLPMLVRRSLGSVFKSGPS